MFSLCLYIIHVVHCLLSYYGMYIDDESIAAIHDAMDEMQYETWGCLMFYERENEEDYVRFISEEGLVKSNEGNCDMNS